MKKRVIAAGIALLMMLWLIPSGVSALSASAALSGTGTVRAGDTVTLTFSLNGGGIYGASGALSYDGGQLSLTGTSQAIGGGWAVEFNGNTFVAYDNNLTAPINGRANLFTATFRVGNVTPGTRLTVSCTGVRASDGASEASIGTVSWTATVAEPLSTDNTLKSMTVSNATVSPAFSPNVTAYSAQVPFEVSKLNVSAVANDAKASVSINSPTLTPNGTTNVTVTVTAENGSQRHYVIAVKRAQDPNYTPSSNSTLSSITVDGFLLSPVFTPDRANYVVWVPFETTAISIGGTAQDALASVTVEGGDNLLAGQENEVRVICTAESGAQTVYTVTVHRAPGHDGAVDPSAPVDTDPITPSDPATGKGGIPVFVLIVSIPVAIALGFGAAWLILTKKKNKPEE